MEISPELEALTRRLLDLLGQVTGLESTYLTKIDWQNDEQEILYSRNEGALDIPEGLRVEWSDTLCKRALDGGPRCTTDVGASYPDSGAAKELGIVTYVTVPVNGPDAIVVGTVCGASTGGVEVSEQALAVMATLADMVALHLVNEQVVRELDRTNAALHEMAFADGLTGVGNRHALERHLTTTAGEAGQAGSSVISVDLDSFKAINDTYGHGAGDDVLCAVADHLTALVRDHDTVARLGGDEFVVILADTDAATATQIAERICAHISGALIETRAGPVAVTVSVGVASDVGADAEGMLTRADEALYAAKAAGRDRIAWV